MRLCRAVPPPISHEVTAVLSAKPQEQNPHHPQGHRHLPPTGVTYLLKLIVGGTRVAQEAIGIEDAAGVILVASQVIASHKVSGS